MSAALEKRLRCQASTARVIVHGRLVTATDIRQVADDWNNCDGGLSGSLEILSDGGVRLKATAAAAIGPTTQNAYYRDSASGVGAPWFTPVSGRPGFANDQIAVGLRLAGNRVGAYSGLKAYLHPRYDATLPPVARTWLATISRYHPQPSILGDFYGTQGTFEPVAWATAQASGEAAAWVQFNFVDASGKPTPVPLGADALGYQYVIVITGFDAAGAPATNVGWGEDTGNHDYTDGSGANTAYFFAATVSAVTSEGGRGQLLIGGGTEHICAVQLIPVSHSASATITFSTHMIDLGSVPTIAPRFEVTGEVPGGTTLLVEARVHSSGSYVTVKSGQTTVDAGIDSVGTYHQQYDIRATLSANAGGNLTPILRQLGMEVVTVQDLGDVAEVTGWQERVDPLTHTAEIGEATIRAIHDGSRDFGSAISALLSQQGPAALTFRVYIGDRSLSIDQWMVKEDFLIDDTDPQGADVGITCLSVLGWLNKQALPKLSSDAVAVPVSDTSNAGSWTASSGQTVGAGSAGAQQLADTAPGTTLAFPNDTTYIESPNNPSSAACVFALGPLGTPADSIPGQVQIQVRAAVDAGGHAVNMRVELMEGATVRATLPNSGSGWQAVTQADAGQGSYAPYTYGLTALQVAAIGNWANLSLRITADKGALAGGKLRLGWARVVQLGTRAPLIYGAGSTVQSAMDDLLDNEIGLDAQYAGPRYADISPALAAEKTISVDSGGATDLTRAKQELDALAWIAGGAFIASQGRVKYVPLYQVSAGSDLLTGDPAPVFAPLLGPVRAVWPLEEVVPMQTGPGWRQRVPLFSVPWGWDDGLGEYAGEAQVTNEVAVTQFPLALVDAAPRASEIAAKWIATDGLARALAVRHAQAFGLGVIEWKVQTAYAYPELEIGDVVAFQVDQFLAFDPVASRALVGKMWVFAVISGCWDALGHEFSVWVQSYSGFAPIPTSMPAVVTLRGASNNLVENGNFEDGWAFWAWGTGSPGDANIAPPGTAAGMIGDEPYAGYYSLQLDCGFGDDAYAWPTTSPVGSRTPLALLTDAAMIAVLPGDTLHVSVASENIGALTKLYFAEHDSRRVHVSDSADVTSLAANTTPFTASTGTYTVPAGVFFVVPVLKTHNSLVGPPHYGKGSYDEVRVNF